MGFSEQMKEIMQKSFESTKSFLAKAAEKAKEVGEKGIIRYELNELEKEAENKFALIGSEVYSLLIEKKQHTISKNTPEIKDVLEELKKLEELMLKKQAELDVIDKDERPTGKTSS
jgi:hypothetical protein